MTAVVGMYAEWASLENEIQCDKANESVLHKFPAAVGREVAATVVRHIAKGLSIAAENAEPSKLNTDKEVKWTMEVLIGISIVLCWSARHIGTERQIGMVAS